MQNYTFYWKNGKRQVLKGTTVADALRRAKLTPEAVSNAEYWFKGIRNDYKFIKGKWVKRIK